MNRVLITGGNKGIGLELTRKFLELNYEIIVIARDFSDFEYTNHKNVQTIEFDMAEVDKIPSLIESIGEVDVLINNAGVMYTLPYNNYPKEKQDSMMNINLYAPIKMIEECAKYMKDGARIVNNASVAAHTGHPDIWYGITKAGILNATKSFAKIFENKIIVNAVAPGIIATGMQEVNSKERKEAFIKNSISKRAGYPEEVAKTIFWLATDAPEYINGTCIDINGGAYPR